jgi:type III pantothenate kinase
MILAIDKGNSKTKLALFQDFNLIELVIIDALEFDKKILEIIKKYPCISEIVLANVGKPIENLKKLNLKINIINHQNLFPFENLYQTPQTLGIDRAVLAAGAVLKYPNSNTLIIDAGTCVTFDYVNEKNQYLGGSISPGLLLRYKSLHDYTANLPLLSPNYPKSKIGNTTFEAIHSGVVNGLLSEIQYITDNFRSCYEKFNIILTGGDTLFLAKRLKNTIFANSNFLLESLILLHQYQQKNDKKDNYCIY